MVSPLAPDRYEVRFTGTAEMRDMIQLAQDMLGCGNGNLPEIFHRALKLLIEDLTKRKFAATDRPRPGRPTAPGSRHIPAEVKRAVWVRDLGRCAFVGTNGRCTERRFLEFHHIEPYAVGGEATVENVSIRCRRHNAHEAELFFGPRKRFDGAGVVKEAAARYGLSADAAGRSGDARPAQPP